MYIRVPVELREMIERSADASERSLNGEIVHRLKQSFADTKKPPEGGSSE